MTSANNTARRQITLGLTAHGIPESEARVSADVGMHAAEQAIATLQSICEPLHGREWGLAYSIALQTGIAGLQSLLEQMQAQAGKLGMGTHHFTVDTRQ